MKSKNSERLLSLDALQDFDMSWIVPGEFLIRSLRDLTNWNWFEWLSINKN